MIFIFLFTVIITILILYSDLYVKKRYYIINNNKIDKNLKIIHLSDFHSEKCKLINKQIFKIIDKEKPDLIVVSGDIVGSGNLNTNIAIKFMKKLSKYNNIYYSCGNHETLIDNIDNFLNKLKSFNINVLNSESINYSDNITIYGIFDPMFFGNRSDSKDIVNNLLKKFRINQNKYNILISHRPDLLNEYCKYNFDLILSGHAHGGQIRLPFINGLYAPDQGILPKLTSGIHKKNKSTMIISKGLGVFNAGFPIRFNNNPEVIIINLNK